MASDLHAADSGNDDEIARRMQSCLDRLVAGDPAAKGDLIAVAYARLEKRAHQMLYGFPAVKRSYDTGDVVQNACLRLMGSLQAVHPENPRRFLGLAGLEIRRTLIDLYRKCRGPESYEANHATNVVRGPDGELRHHVDDVAAAGSVAGHSSPWERLHEAAEALDEADKELFHMRWFLGMTHVQIAALLGCSDKTVKRDWNRVKEFLRRAAGDGSGI